MPPIAPLKVAVAEPISMVSVSATPPAVPFVVPVTVKAIFVLVIVGVLASAITRLPVISRVLVLKVKVLLESVTL